MDAGRGAASAGRADRTDLRTHGLRTGRRGFRCGRLLRRRGRRGRGNRRRIVRRGCRPRDGPRNPGRRRAGASCEDALRRDRRNDRSEPLDRRTDRGEKNRRFGHRRRLGTLCDPAGRASGPRRAQSAGHRRQRPPRHGLRIAFGVARHRRKPVVLVGRRPRAAPQSADAARRGFHVGKPLGEIPRHLHQRRGLGPLPLGEGELRKGAGQHRPEDLREGVRTAAPPASELPGPGDARRDDGLLQDSRKHADRRPLRHRRRLVALRAAGAEHRQRMGFEDDGRMGLREQPRRSGPGAERARRDLGAL